MNIVGLSMRRLALFRTNGSISYVNRTPKLSITELDKPLILMGLARYIPNMRSTAIVMNEQAVKRYWKS